MQSRISVSTNSFGIPVRSALKIASRLSASAVRCDLRTELKPKEMSETGLREFSYLLRELSLELPAVNFTVRRPFYEHVDLDARISATRQAMDLAAKLKVRSLCLKFGKIPDVDKSTYPVLQQAISDLARYGNHIGVTLTMIPVGQPIQLIRDFLDSIKSGPVAIDFDPSRFLLAEQEIPEAIRGLHHYIQQFTVQDAVRDFSGGRENTQLGRGEITWDKTLATLHEIGYRGFLHLPKPIGEEPEQSLVNAMQYLTNVTGELW